MIRVVIEIDDEHLPVLIRTLVMLRVPFTFIFNPKASSSIAQQVPQAPIYAQYPQPPTPQPPVTQGPARRATEVAVGKELAEPPTTQLSSGEGGEESQGEEGERAVTVKAPKPPSGKEVEDVVNELRRRKVR